MEEESTLSDKQKEVLRRKDRLAEKAKEIISIMSKYEPGDNADKNDILRVKQNIFDIFNDLGAIGTIAGGKVANKLNDGIDKIRTNIVLIEGVSKDDLSIQRIYMEPMLLEIVGFAIKFDKGVLVDVGWNVEPLTGKFGGRFSRGK